MISPEARGGRTVRRCGFLFIFIFFISNTNPFHFLHTDGNISIFPGIIPTHYSNPEHTIAIRPPICYNGNKFGALLRFQGEDG
jgi:hypothetical protein